jgi:hypothetical protein
MYGTLPAAARETAIRALAVHPEGCPAHQSVKDAIAITWDAVRMDGATVTVGSDDVEERAP